MNKRELYFSLYNGLAGDRHLLLKAVDKNNNLLHSELFNRDRWFKNWRLNKAKSRIHHELEEKHNTDFAVKNDISLDNQYKINLIQ
jgi:hypothetical protein